jgi:hypothetical protein
VFLARSIHSAIALYYVELYSSTPMHRKQSSISSVATGRDSVVVSHGSWCCCQDGQGEDNDEYYLELRDTKESIYASSSSINYPPQSPKPARKSSEFDEGNSDDENDTFEAVPVFPTGYFGTGIGAIGSSCNSNDDSNNSPSLSVTDQPRSTTFELPYSVIVQATQNFSAANFIGDGGSCSVYKAQLNSKWVAVKTMRIASSYDNSTGTYQYDVEERVNNSNGLDGSNNTSSNNTSSSLWSRLSAGASKISARQDSGLKSNNTSSSSMNLWSRLSSTNTNTKTASGPTADTITSELNQQFLTEMHALQRVRHPNICCLVAMALDGPKRCLALELCVGGALSEWLYGDTQSLLQGELQQQQTQTSTGQSPDTVVILSCRQRVQVAVAVGKALAYMHQLSPPLLHRDVKTQNVLLTVTPSDVLKARKGKEGARGMEMDMMFVTKVSDFGTVDQKDHTVKLTEAADPGDDNYDAAEANRFRTRNTSDVVGTTAYMPAEYENFGELSEKTDAFAYGIVLLELITGFDAREVRAMVDSVHQDQDTDSLSLTSVTELSQKPTATIIPSGGSNTEEPQISRKDWKRAIFGYGWDRLRRKHSNHTHGQNYQQPLGLLLDVASSCTQYGSIDRGAILAHNSATAAGTSTSTTATAPQQVAEIGVLQVLEILLNEISKYK